MIKTWRDFIPSKRDKLGLNNSTVDNSSLIKKATFSLIGDDKPYIHIDSLYSRVKDQADKYGVYCPSWVIFVDTVRILYPMQGEWIFLVSIKETLDILQNKLSRRNLQIKNLKKRLKDIEDNMWRYSLEYPED
jgi:hypothetical protein